MDGRESKIETIKADNKINEQKTFYSEKPSERYSGIKYAHINDSTMSIRLKSYGFFEEYVAPTYTEKKLVSYAGHPNKIVFFAGTIVFAGLPFILNPKTWMENLVGWKEEISTEVLIKKELGKKTGKSIWQETSGSNDISVNAGGNSRVIHSVDSYHEHDFALKSDILNGGRISHNIISVSCLNCDLRAAPSGLEKLYDKIEFDIDLRELKKRLESEEKKELESRLNSKKAETELGAPRVTDDSPSLKIIKTQCNDLGFKLGTKDFGNCVMQLMGH